MKVVPIQVTLVDSMGSDLSVVNAARVSFDKFHEFFDQTNDLGLIKYLAKHNHWSPFAHAFVSFRIKAPLFVARQLGKHQVGLVWNEVSRRYVDSEPEFFIPDVWRGKPEGSIKQGSGGAVTYQGFFSIHLKEVIEQSLYAYDIMLDCGIAPEQARMVLPQNTMTEWIWSGSLYAFARVCNLRLDSHAQKECRDVAQLISDEMQKLFPESWKVLVKQSQ